MNNKKNSKIRRQISIRGKIKEVSNRMRLSVFRSNKYFYAQIIDDAKAKTIIGVSEKNLGKETTGKKYDRAKQLGLLLAKNALLKKVKNVVFDRGRYKYHGRVKAFAEGVREGGLQL